MDDLAKLCLALERMIVLVGRLTWQLNPGGIFRRLTRALFDQAAEDEAVADVEALRLGWRRAREARPGRIRDAGGKVIWVILPQRHFERWQPAGAKVQHPSGHNR